MGEWLPPRLRQFLGDDLDAVEAKDVARLVGLSESTDLDFKSDAYGRSDSEKKELALDVASFANSGGGLLVVGIGEDGFGTGARVTPITDTATDHDLRMRQVIAGRVDPVPVMHVKRVEVGNGDVWLVSVPPAARAPHAVAVGDSLRYVVRDGPGKRALSEAEVADRYARRFAGVEERHRALTELVADARSRANELDSEWTWLVVALVPDIPGSLRLRRGLAEEWAQWVNPALREFPGLDRGRVEASPGFRCLEVSDSAGERRVVRAQGGRLMVDGSGYLLLGQPPQPKRTSPNVVAETNRLYDEALWGDLINGLGVLARHADKCNSAGDAQVAAFLFSSTRQIILAEYRSMSRGQLIDTFPIEGFSGVSTHTVTLAGCVTPGPELVAAARLLGSDLVSAFGAPEPQQLTRGSAFALNRFATANQDRVKQWADSAGVEVLPEWTD